MRSASKKVLVVTTALGVVALGTGVSLAATQGGNQSVTCIVLADAKAAVDANSALSDHFAVGTKLHLTSAGRAVDVTVSGAITAAAPAPSTSTADPAPSESASDPAPSESASDPAPSESATDPAPSESASAPAPSGSAGGSNQGGKKHHRRHHRPKSSATAKAPAKAAAAKSVTVKAAVSGKNGGVDPNTVCVELSKNAFNTLGAVGNGNNVGAFIATMTPADAKQ
jgi:hypothetical protein